MCLFPSVAQISRKVGISRTLSIDVVAPGWGWPPRECRLLHLAEGPGPTPPRPTPACKPQSLLTASLQIMIHASCPSSILVTQSCEPRLITYTIQLALPMGHSTGRLNILYWATPHIEFSLSAESYTVKQGVVPEADVETISRTGKSGHIMSGLCEVFREPKLLCL